MFEKIILRRSDTGVALTPGEIAEALLFYQNVHLVLDPTSIRSISTALGMREFLALIRRKRVSAVYTNEMLMVHSSPGSIPHHGFMTGFMSGGQSQQPRKGRRAVLEWNLEQSGHSGGESKKLAGQFLELIPVKQYSNDYFTPGGILKSANADLNDANYVTEAVRRVLQNQAGFESFADNLKIEVVRLPDQSVVLVSSIDFVVANERRKHMNPTNEPFTEGNLLSALLDANADVNLASFYGGDFHTSSMNSNIVRIRFAELLRRTGISNLQLQQFKDVALADYPTIREVINSKERSFAEFENLLDQSDKFRHSVHQMGPDANLVAEYFNEVRKEGWISKLPAKSIRYVIGLGVGGVATAVGGPAVGAAAGTIAGAAWGAADTFLLDRLKGWRPNHFVDGKLKPFLGGDP